MKALAGDRRARLRAMRADLKMPGALEAVDGILQQADGGAVTAAKVIVTAPSLPLPTIPTRCT